jgi:hypothetical protein
VSFHGSKVSLHGSRVRDVYCPKLGDLGLYFGQ